MRKVKRVPRRNLKNAPKAKDLFQLGTCHARLSKREKSLVRAQPRSKFLLIRLGNTISRWLVRGRLKRGKKVSLYWE